MTASNEKIDIAISSPEDEDNIKPVAEKTTKKPTAKRDEIDDDDGSGDEAVARVRQHESLGLQSVTDFPRWLKINLMLGNITVGLMFVVALVNLAFADVMRGDLTDDPYDSSCASHYIKGASALADGNRDWIATEHGPYHSQCQRLYLTSYVVLVAGSFSLLRAIPICFFPVQTPSRFTIRYRPNGFFDRLTTPSRIYTLRTFFSIIPAALYLFGVVSISTSPFMTGPITEDSYKTMYIVALACLAFSAVASMHQAATTAYAGLVWKLWRQSLSSLPVSEDVSVQERDDS